MARSSDQSNVDVAILLGYIATKDLTTTEKKIAVLSNLGFSNPEMARICGTNVKVVKTLKSKIKLGVRHDKAS